MLNFKKISCFIWLVGCLLFVNNALAQQLLNIDELKSFVNEGVQYVKEKGTKVAYEEFNKTNGKFVRNGKYLFVYDFKGRCLAHGGDPKKYVGKNLFNYKDKFGEFAVQSLINVAKNGEGYAGFYMVSPQNGVEEFKLAYIKAVGDDTFVGSGLFLK